MFEVTFINGDDDYLFLYELSHQPANPKSSLIEVSVSILGIGFVELSELQIEPLFHDLSKNSC
jgi:hypothetical protein